MSRCADGRCRTFFRAAGVPPESRRLGFDWIRAQRDRLNHFAWVERDAGIVKIPIEDAMGLIVHERAVAEVSRAGDDPRNNAGR